MKDHNEMTSEQKRDYIFKDPFEGRTRFKWISDCLLGDIKTFLEGIENRDESADGGGNLSVPILTNTALEFVAELYEGNTENIWCFTTDMNEELTNDWKEFKIDSLPEKLKAMIKLDGFDISKKNIKSISKSIIETKNYVIKKEGHKLKVYEKYNATGNVIKFIEKYFPDKYQDIPNILWSGTRNGLVHTFYPTFFEYQDNYIISFEFSVRNPSEVRKDNRSSSETPYNIVIRLNVFDLYEVLKEAIEKYLVDLKEKKNLQENFMKAWKSIELNKKHINPSDRKAKEFKALLSKLQNSNNHLLLR